MTKVGHGMVLFSLLQWLKLKWLFLINGII